VTVYATSLGDLTSLINAKTSAALTNEFDVIGIIATPSGESPRNTKAMLQAKTTSTVYQGRKVIYYDRLNLADLAKFQYFKVPIEEDISIYAALNLLRDALGIKFTTDDLVETQTVLTETGVEVTLTAKPGSLGWTGTVTLEFNELPHISTAFYSDKLNGF
jgi:hypothetical protein